MLRKYIIFAENADNHLYELINCKDCKYFRKAEDHDYRYRDSCDNPAGLVRPNPDGFCNYAIEKSIYEREADHE